jgi:putative heme-binding domain-containing protein
MPLTTKNIALVSLVILASAVTVRADEARNDAIIVRAIERMEGYDYSENEKVKAAIARHIDRSKGTTEYLTLLKRFRPEGLKQKIEAVLYSDDNSSAVEAAKIMTDTEGGPTRLRQLLRSEDQEAAARVAEVLGFLATGRTHRILSDYASDDKIPYSVRRATVVGLTKSAGGSRALLDIAASKKLVGDSRLLAGALLARSTDESIRTRAANVLPQPAMNDRKPLPPIDKLATMKGDADAGLKLFRSTATCSNCHVVNQFGKEVGPNLSEIGSKLSREAMLASILDPSAGISHNYENYSVLTEAGQVIVGIKVSQTDDEVVIRTAEAIDRKIPANEIELIKKSDKSIMPENLHHAFSQQGLVDIIEYMTTLRKNTK